MAEIDRARVKSVYGELKGYLEQLPPPSAFNGPTRIGKRFNVLCDELTSITRTDYTALKLSEIDDDEDYNGYGFDGATLKAGIGGLLSRLAADYGFSERHESSLPAIVINNLNSNAIDININFTIETLIDAAETDEEKTQLEVIKDELKKPEANWERVRTALAWVLNYSKELSIKVLPLIFEHYLKRGGVS